MIRDWFSHGKSPPENPWTWRRSTSCGRGSSASPGTTTSAGCCTWRRLRTTSRSPTTRCGLGLRQVYGGDIELVDLTPGMYADPAQGFRLQRHRVSIFVLMASRRLNSDRFFTDEYTARVYTQAGMDWIEDNTMVTVLTRHYPGLRRSMGAVKNGFEPWERPGSRQDGRPPVR